MGKHWPFLRQIFAAGLGPRLIGDLANRVSDGDASPYTQESLSWLRHHLREFQAFPSDMEQATRFRAPLETIKFREAIARLDKHLRAEKPRPILAAAVLGGTPQDVW